jgi:hypothetical protein
MKVTDLVPDKKNARRRTTRGAETIEHSLRELGAGRSIVIDRDGKIIAGNGVIESAGKAGITEVEVIESDGSRIIAVKRTDLGIDDPKARQLAVADNRTAELAEWVPGTLVDLSASLDLHPFFTADELSRFILPGVEPVPEVPEGNYHEQYGVTVICKDAAEQEEIYERLTGEGLTCRVVVT